MFAQLKEKGRGCMKQIQAQTKRNFMNKYYWEVTSLDFLPFLAKRVEWCNRLQSLCSAFREQYSILFFFPSFKIKNYTFYRYTAAVFKVRISLHLRKTLILITEAKAMSYDKTELGWKLEI